MRVDVDNVYHYFSRTIGHHSSFGMWKEVPEPKNSTTSETIWNNADTETATGEWLHGTQILGTICISFTECNQVDNMFS